MTEIHHPARTLAPGCAWAQIQFSCQVTGMGPIFWYRWVKGDGSDPGNWAMLNADLLSNATQDAPLKIAVPWVQGWSLEIAQLPNVNRNAPCFRWAGPKRTSVEQWRIFGHTFVQATAEAPYSLSVPGIA